MWRSIKRSFVAAVACAALMAGSETALANCFPWNAAGSLIAANGLMPASAAYAQIKAKYPGGKITHAELCQNGNSFVYHFVVVDKSGNVHNESINAK
jgi:hypothetical protein